MADAVAEAIQTDAGLLVKRLLDQMHATNSRCMPSDQGQRFEVDPVDSCGREALQGGHFQQVGLGPFFNNINHSLSEHLSSQHIIKHGGTVR